jgi:ribosomal protein S3
LREAFKNNANIIGLRLKIKGKINGKKRATSLVWSIGIVTVQVYQAQIKYAHTYCYNIFGSFGIKLWVNLST